MGNRYITPLSILYCPPNKSSEHYSNFLREYTTPPCALNSSQSRCGFSPIRP